jgi:DNA polymerase-4
VSEPAVRKIIHIDMDAFYASVEQRDDPSLRGRPVAVGFSAKRGVVAAASYEARAFGVRSAMPAVTALRRCPDLIFTRPRFEVYRAVSRQIQAIFADYADLVEPLSLDEAYLDVTANRRGHAGAAETAREIRARILAETGLTASAGVSYNKLLAKLASDHRKPNGQFVVPPERGEAFVEALPVGKFPGVGPVTAEKLATLGINTGADLRRQSLAFLQARFGKSGAWFHAVARAEDSRPVVADRPRKSAGSETTFANDLVTPEEIETALVALADEVFAWCAKADAFGRTATIKIRWADFQTCTRSRTLSAPIVSGEALRAASRDLARGLFPPRLGVRLAGVSVSHFEPAREVFESASQLDLAL